VEGLIDRLPQRSPERLQEDVDEECWDAAGQQPNCCAGQARYDPHSSSLSLFCLRGNYYEGNENRYP